MMDPTRAVVILGALAEAIAAPLRAALPGLDVRIGGDVPEPPYAVIAFSPGGALARYPDAAWIHVAGAGANGVLEALHENGLAPPPLITRTVGRMGRQIGEYVLSYWLADVQKHAERRRLQRDRNWDVAAGTPG
ncbi:MAG: hypothetical protein WBA35_10115, partial [Litorimonas sp.]